MLSIQVLLFVQSMLLSIVLTLLLVHLNKFLSSPSVLQLLSYFYLIMLLFPFFFSLP